MRRTNTPEILDSDDCPPDEIAKSLRDLSRINRWFGGVSTTRKLIERVASKTKKNRFTLLEVAAGFGEIPKIVAAQLRRKHIALEVTLLDRAHSHLLGERRSVVADALAIPFPDNSFDLVDCSLFAHHLQPDELARFAAESLRVSRCAVLINDLVRHPMHVALVYAGFPLMRSYVSRFDGLASVRKAYTPEEMTAILAAGGARAGQIEVSRHYLFRMGAILWKANTSELPALL
jgi:SAM-dependent methyltransferase